MGRCTLGTCSLCGGRVMGFNVWWSVSPPPPPECADCGAVAASHGPVIPMRQPARTPAPFHQPSTLGGTANSWTIVSRANTGDVS